MMHHDAIYRRVALCKTAHFFIGQVKFKLRQCCEHSSLLKHLHHERHRDRAASSDSAGNRPPQPRHRAPYVMKPRPIALAASAGADTRH